MGAFSQGLKNTAARLLATYGQIITGIRRTEQPYNPATGDLEEFSETALKGVGYPSSYNTMQVNSGLVRQDDILLIYSSDVAPIVNDIYTVNNKDYTALTIQNISAQAQSIIYKVQLRQ